MAKIVNKFNQVFKNPDGSPSGYLEVIKSLIDIEPVAKMNLEQMSQRLALSKKIQKALDKKEDLSVNKEELALIKHKVKTSTWAIAHEEILEFGDYINSLK